VRKRLEQVYFGWVVVQFKCDPEERRHPVVIQSEAHVVFGGPRDLPATYVAGEIPRSA
jgi:hypothetical protein